MLTRRNLAVTSVAAAAVTTLPKFGQTAPKPYIGVAHQSFIQDDLKVRKPHPKLSKSWDSGEYVRRFTDGRTFHDLPIYDMLPGISSHVVNEEGDSVVKIEKSKRMMVPMLDHPGLDLNTGELSADAPRKLDEMIFRLFRIAAGTKHSNPEFSGSALARGMMEVSVEVSVPDGTPRVALIYLREVPQGASFHLSFNPADAAETAVNARLGKFFDVDVYQSDLLSPGEAFITSKPDYLGVMPRQYGGRQIGLGVYNPKGLVHIQSA